MEQWKEIGKSKGCLVSSLRRVKGVLGNEIFGGLRAGYRFVKIAGKNISIHRLVAIAFIPNPENKPCVNHKDFNKLNNSVDNLEWVSYSENNIHAIPVRSKIVESKRNPVAQYDLLMNFIQNHVSITEASVLLNINRQNIGQCAKGKVKSAGGFIWKLVTN